MKEKESFKPFDCCLCAGWHFFEFVENNDFFSQFHFSRFPVRLFILSLYFQILCDIGKHGNSFISTLQIPSDHRFFFLSFWFLSSDFDRENHNFFRYKCTKKYLIAQWNEFCWEKNTHTEKSVQNITKKSPFFQHLLNFLKRPHYLGRNTNNNNNSTKTTENRFEMKMKKRKNAFGNAIF